MKSLPYKNRYNNQYINRLIVEPFRISEKVTSMGIIRPGHELITSEIGTIVSSGDDSLMNQGDTVMYDKIDRNNPHFIQHISIYGKVCDVLFENEVWCCNNEPVNRIFIKPVSSLEISEGGLIVPHEIRSITEKGLVFKADPKFNLQLNDKVEYRKNKDAIYPTITIDDVVYDVLFEADIFKVNDKVAPHRMIVKIDLAQQNIKRSWSATGLALSPLFQAMLYNLQFAEVTAIGKEAQKMYPDLRVGDTAIMHHCVEDNNTQSYRILGTELGSKHKQPLYEYRVINCWDEKSREIFGKLHWDKKTGKIIDITPLNNNIFLKWDFDLFEGSGDNSLIATADDDIRKYTNLDDLRNILNHKKNEAAEKAKAKISGISLTMNGLNPILDKEKLDNLSNEREQIVREETKLAAYLRKNHWVVCTMAYPREIPPFVIGTWEELYPINILGNKFIIASPDFLIAKSNTNMNIKLANLTPLKDRVFVLPIEEEIASMLLVPDSAKEKPISGKVVATWVNDLGVQKDSIVLFPPRVGMVQEIEGKEYLVMFLNDLVAIV